MQDRPRVRSSPVETLRIALPVVPHSALLHIAKLHEYFTEEGLDVVLMPVSYGAAAIGSVLQEKADLAVATDVPFVISVMKGNPLGMVANLGSISNDHAIIARRDRAIAAPGDLAGKKIGVSFGTSGSYFLWTFLTRNKLESHSVVLVDLPPERIVAALADGSVDAVATWQPMLFQAQAVLGKESLSLSGAGAYRGNIAVFGRNDFLKGHTVAIEKFVRAILKAERFAQTRSEEMLTLTAQWLKIDVDAQRPTWNQFDFRVSLLQSQLVTLEDEARWAMASGYVPRRAVPNFLPHLYLDALLVVLPERVTVIH